MTAEPFAMVQMEILRDRRLNFTDTRVLIALLASFDPRKKHEPVFPRLATLARRAGCSEKMVSAATSRLVKYGWVAKESGRGHQATRYFLHTPEIEDRLEEPTGLPSTRESDSSQSGSGLPPERDSDSPESRSLTPLRAGVPIEQTKKQTKEQTSEHRPRKTKWRVVPDGETLTPDREAFALGEGMTLDAVEREWARFCDHEFRAPKQDVTRTWRNWVRNSSDWRGGTQPARTADQKQRDVFAEVRRDLGIGGAG